MIAINVKEAFLPNRMGKVLRPLALSLTRSRRILLAILIKPMMITIGTLNQIHNFGILPV